MSVMRDTSHSAIGPSGPLEQSPFGDTWRHVSTALLSSALECGENARNGRQGRKERFKTLGYIERKRGSVTVNALNEAGLM